MEINNSFTKWLFYAACRLAGFREGEISKFVDNYALTERLHNL